MGSGFAGAAAGGRGGFTTGGAAAGGSGRTAGGCGGVGGASGRAVGVGAGGGSAAVFSAGVAGGQKDWTSVFAGRIGQAIEKWGVDATFVDDTGGWGAGVIDALVAAGYLVIPVNFGGKAMDPRYKNRRAEMHFAAADMIMKGGALPHLPELQREATATTYWFRKGVFEIEEKAQVMVKLNGESPDLWDAYCLTFAQPVAPRTGNPWLDARHGRAKTEPDEGEE